MPEGENGWFPPPGQDPSRVNYTVQCGGPPPTVDPKACSEEFCLFNITADPCEYTDLAAQHPTVVANLTAMLAEFQATAVAPVGDSGCPPRTVPVPNWPAPHGAQMWWPCDYPAPGSV